MLKVVRITFYTILVLFLLDIFNVFQTKIGFLKALIYFGVLILPIPLLIMEFKANRSLTKSMFRKGIPMLIIIGLLYVNPLIIFFNTSTWKTQTIELVDKNWSNHKVEFQMRDIGAFGYAKRKAEVVYFLNYFYFVWAEKYDDRNFLEHQWKRVNLDSNEMGLK